ncbi:hypothetical protein D3C76_751510 [compost metagenome]
MLADVSQRVALGIYHVEHQRDRLAEHFLGLVAEQMGDGFVDIDHHTFGVGYHQGVVSALGDLDEQPRTLIIAAFRLDPSADIRGELDDLE